MPAADPPLTILPGELLVFFVVRLDDARVTFTAHCTRFLEGLKAACDLLRFGPVQRDEERLDEILPWAGNV